MVSSQQSHAVWKKPVLAVLVALAVAAMLSACGGAQFERTPGSKKYRALPKGTPVQLVGSVDELKQPTEEIGTLKMTIKGSDHQMEEAAARLKQSASKYGCDAVVGMKSDKREVKKVKTVTTMGAGGVRTRSKVHTTSHEHDWTALCVRSAAAPKEVPRTRRRRGKKSSTAAASTTTTTASATGSGSGGGSTTKTTTATGTAAGTSTAAGAGGMGFAPPRGNNGDPKLASEVARAFLTFSKYISTGNVNMLCKTLDTERIYFDIRTKNPKLLIKIDLPPETACASLRSGDLGSYLRDFGPAEVHAEIPTLVPSLFRIHGGAYLKLNSAQESQYAKKLRAQRSGRRPLACSMYTVLPAGNLFKISVKCDGVASYRLLMRRDGPDDFKLMAMTHIR